MGLFFLRNFIFFFFILFCIVQLFQQNFRYVAVFGSEEIVKERSCAMSSLNILIYNKIIKQTVKPAVHVQNMTNLNMLQFEVNYVLSRIKHNQLTNPLNLLMKVCTGQSTQYKTG